MSESDETKREPFASIIPAHPGWRVVRVIQGTNKDWWALEHEPVAAWGVLKDATPDDEMVAVALMTGFGADLISALPGDSLLGPGQYAEMREQRNGGEPSIRIVTKEDTKEESLFSPVIPELLTAPESPK